MFFRQKRLLKRVSVGNLAFKAEVARDASTPVAVLNVLAMEESADVRKEVAANAGTPMETLYGLSHDEDKSVRQSALARLLELSTVKDASCAVWEQTTSPQLVAAIAEDLNCSDLSDLCGTRVRYEITAEAPTPRREVLAELARAGRTRLRQEVAGSKFAPPSSLTLLASDSYDGVRIAVAGNPSTPPNTLAALLSDPNEEVSEHALYNGNLPARALVAAAEDQRPAVRKQLATVAATTAETLSQLAKDESPEVRRAVASNINAGDQTLIDLSSDPDEEVRLNVALDAKTGERFFDTRKARDLPVEALLKLAGDASPTVRQAVADHRCLPLDGFIALAKDPDNNTRRRVESRILRHGDSWADEKNEDESDFYVEVLTSLSVCSDIRIRKAVAQHPLLPIPLLAELLDDELVFGQESGIGDLPVLSVVRNRPWYTDDDWRALTRVSNPKARATLAYLSTTPKDVLTLLASDDDEEVRKQLLHNKELPANVVRTLVEDPSPSVADMAASFLAKNAPRFRAEIGAFLDANNPKVRATLAREETADVKWLESLALDPSADVRVAVAGNSNTPPSVFASLALDSNLEVVQAVVKAIRDGVASPAAIEAVLPSTHTEIRLAVAAKSGLSSETLRCLVQDPVESVRVAAAANGRTIVSAFLAVIASDDLNEKYGIGQTSVAALCALAEDETIGVDSLHSLAQSPFAEVRRSVVKNPAVSKATLANLTRDASPQVREAVAGHCDTPLEGLMALANDASAEVRAAVAKNPRTSSEALALLDQDPDEGVALAVAVHPNTPAGSLDALVEVHDQPKINEGNSLALTMLFQGKLDRLSWRHELLGHLTRSDNSWHQGVRQAVASNLRVSPETLITLSQQPDTVAFVAGNPSTPAPVLSQLIRHEDSLVREAAASNTSLPEAQLSALALDQQEAVRRCVASNPHTGVQTLEILANDFSSKVNGAARSALSARSRLAEGGADDQQRPTDKVQPH
jgi:hypothetical protein